MDNRRENGTQMISKTFAILEYMSRNGSARLQEISSCLGIPQSTMLRYLNSMIHAGYIYQDQYTMRYALTWRICNLGENLNTPSAAKNIVSPYVIRLSQQLNVGAAAMIAHGFDGIYLDLIDDPSTILTSMMRIGNCPPLNSTASGKVLLSRYEDNEIERYIEERGLVRSTAETIVDKDRFLDEIHRVREMGYALEIRECSDDVECVAVPVYDFSGQIYMALSIFKKACITEPKVLHEKILPYLGHSAKEISERFGCPEGVWTDWPR